MGDEMSKNTPIDNPIELSTAYRENANLSVGTDEFPEHWIRWFLWGALQRQSLEAHLIDQSNPAYLAAIDSFTALDKSREWITPELREFLINLGRVIGLEELDYELRPKTIYSNGIDVKMLERHVSHKYVKVSDRNVHSIPVVDDTFSRAHLCRDLVELFTKRLESLCQETDATHLLFIEKEYGPIGAVLMYTSLVSSLGMSACILREMHLGDRFFVGELPTEDDKVVIVYDLCVSGQGLSYAATLLADTYGSHTVGALVFEKYSAQDTLSYTTQAQDKNVFRLDSLSVNNDDPHVDNQQLQANASPIGGVVEDTPSSGALAIPLTLEEEVTEESHETDQYEGTSQQEHRLEPPPWARPMPEEERARLSDPRNIKRPHPVKIRPQMTAEQLNKMKAETHRREGEWVKKCEEAKKKGEPIPPHPFFGF